MKDSVIRHQCKSCGFKGTGNFCSHCGQSLILKRISINGLLKDVFHFITHFETGFGYTLKQLAIAPGRMQRKYIQGNRIKHQKPFAMFFISVTIASLVHYWISSALMKYYKVDLISDVNYYHHYMVIMYIMLFPVYSLITYLFFYKSGSNYAEIGVLMLYTLSFVFLMASVIALIILIWPRIDTAYIEFPVFTFYFIITFLNYFNANPRSVVVIKGILIMIVAFFINDLMEDLIIDLISKY